MRFDVKTFFVIITNNKISVQAWAATWRREEQFLAPQKRICGQIAEHQMRSSSL